MIKDQCVSVTDLRLHTKKCLENLKKGKKYIFVNNKPMAVLMDIEEYENYFHTDLVPLPEKDLTPDLKQKITQSKRTSKTEFLNI